MRLLSALALFSALCLPATAQEIGNPGFPPGVFLSRSAQDGVYVAPTTMTTPFLTFSSGGPSTGSNSYAPINSQGNVGTGFITSPIAQTQSPWASAGYFSNFTVYNPNGNLSGGSIVVGLSVSSTLTSVTTVLSCTLSTTVSNCSSAGGSGITVTAGQYVDLTAVPTGASGTTSNITIGFEYTDTTGVHSVLCGGNGLMNAAPQNIFMGVGAWTGYTAPEQIVSDAIPTGGTIDNLYVVADTNPSGDFITVTAYAGGTVGGTSAPTSDTAQLLAVPLSLGATTGNDTNAGHAISIAAPSGSPPTANTFALNIATVTVRPRVNACVRWTPTTAGQALALDPQPLNLTTTNKFSLITGAGNNNTSQTNEVAPTTMSIDDAFFAISTPPGGTATRTMQLQYGASLAAPTNVSGFICTIASANYGCAPGQSLTTISQNDQLDWTLTLSGSPASNTWAKYSAVVCTGSAGC